MTHSKPLASRFMWDTLIAGSLGLGGVALGGWLERNSAARALEATIREQRRESVHVLLATLIDDVGTKVEESWLMLPMLAKMSERDLNEFMDTDTGRAMREREQRIKTTQVQIGLLVGDTALREALLRLEIALREWPDKATGLVTAHAMKTGGNALDKVSEAFEHVVVTRSHLTDVQRRAAVLLAVALSPDPSPKLRQRISGRLKRSK